MMDKNVLIKILTSLVSFNSSLMQLWNTIRERRRSSNKAKSQVGKLGKVYFWLIDFPRQLNHLLLLIVLVFSFAALIAGWNYIEQGKSPVFPFDWIWEKYYYIFIVYSCISILFIHLNGFSHMLTEIVKKIGFMKYTPGIINANWHLENPTTPYAININTEACRRLANAIISFHVKNNQDFPDRTPRPEIISNIELANYLIFGNAMESQIHENYPREKTILSKGWAYLKWAAESNFRPFKASHLLRIHNERQSFYDFLVGLKSQSTERGTPPNSFIQDPFLKETLDAILATLCKKHKGDGTRLAKGLFSPKGSPKLLFRRLDKYPKYKKNFTYKRLFLKLAGRMEVWPSMKMGPFLYPFSYGNALIMLNSSCLVTTDNIETIAYSDTFADIVAFVEDQIIKILYHIITQQSEDEKIKKFTKAIFDSTPEKIDLWKLSDFIDFWFFSHGRHFCQKRDESNNNVNIGCELEQYPSGPCFCDFNQSKWFYEQKKLVKK